MNDNVTHPAHYTFGGIEVLDAIEAWELPYHLGNCVKYIVRAGRKDPTKTVEDLQKARFYLDRYIGNMDKHETGNPRTDNPEPEECDWGDAE